MKPKTLTLVGAAGLAAVIALAVVISRRPAQPPASTLTDARTSAASRPASGNVAAGPVRFASTTPEDAPVAPSEKALNPATAQIVNQLRGLKALTGGKPADMRKLISELEGLRAMGPAALPALRDYLASADDTDYEAGGGRGFRGGRVPTEFLVPPSLRLGLLEVVKDIGGAEGQQVLMQELKTTGRGVEVAYIAAALQQMGGEQHRETVAAAARDLLAMPPLPTAGASRLDRSDREYLYSVLTQAGDRSYVAQAQAQVVQPNGQIDQASLRYLQTTLGEQSVSVAAQLWANPQIAADRKEPIAQMALNYVGLNEQANQLFQSAINDPAIEQDDRRDLIEDLNERGFADRRNPTPADLALVEKRLALIASSLTTTTDPSHVAAFKEAQKDLLEMRERATRPRS